MTEMHGEERATKMTEWIIDTTYQEGNMKTEEIDRPI